MDEASRHSLAALALLRAHASDFCREAGVGFPASLLSAGLPTGAWADDSAQNPMRDNREKRPVPAIRSLDTLVGWWVDTHPDRKGAGLFLTPRSVARTLLIEAARDGRVPASELDPAAGAGVFLLESHDLFGPGIALYGIDRDPMAVAATRLALWIAGAESNPSVLCERIRVADALEVDAASGGPPADWLPAGGIDLVCGNPPFGNAIEKRTALSQRGRDAMARRFPEVARGPYDRSVLFVRLAGEWCSSGGKIALLVPRVLLAARYAVGLREWSEREAPITDVVRFPGDTPCPDAAVSMIGWIARKGTGDRAVRVVETETDAEDRRPPSRSESRSARASVLSATERAPRVVLREDLRNESWGALIDPLAARIEAIARTHPCLGETCTVRSGSTVEEAYRIAGEIREGGEDEEGWRFLISGSIARCGDRWGDRSSRYLGRRFNRPVLPREAGSLNPARRSLYDSPKVIVCGLSRVLRAREDASGEFAGSVGTFLVMPRCGGDGGGIILRRLCIVLNSAWYSMVHRARRGASALSGGNLPLLRRDIEEFPLPAVFSRGDHLGRLDDLDPVRDDARAQRVVLELAGYCDEDARAIIEAWTAWLEPRRRRRPPDRVSPR